jgi:hypothetical protein
LVAPETATAPETAAAPDADEHQGPYRSPVSEGGGAGGAAARPLTGNRKQTVVVNAFIAVACCRTGLLGLCLTGHPSPPDLPSLLVVALNLSHPVAREIFYHHTHFVPPRYIDEPGSPGKKPAITVFSPNMLSGNGCASSGPHSMSHRRHRR